MKRTLIIAFLIICWVFLVGSPLKAQETIETLEAGRQCVTLTFEGFPSLDPISYTIEPGVTFVEQSVGGRIIEIWRAVDTLGWGVSNNPSGASIALWWITDANQWPPWPWSADIAFEEPVSAVSLHYASLFDVTIEALNSDGNFLESVTMPLNVVTAFDTWDFLDVERDANEITTVRITGGATATMIDDFKFCRTLGPLALCAAMINEIETLFEDDVIPQRQSQALIRKLKRVVRLVEKGRPRLAKMAVRTFIWQVKRLVRRDILTAADGQFLIENAGVIEFTPAE